MDQDKLARLRQMIEQRAMSPEAGVDPEAIAQAEAAAQAEREGNQMAQYANILATMTENITGARKGHRLGMQQEALNKLKSLQRQAGKGDSFKALLERYRQAEINSRLGENLQRRDESLKQGQQKIGQAQQKIEQPSEKTAKEFATLDTLQSELDSALADLDKQTSREDLNVPATGILRNLLEGAKSLGEEIGVSSPDVELGSLKAKIAGFSAEKLREKFGAQVTVQEMDKVKPYIPLPGDTPTEVRTKIKNLKREIGIIIKDRKKALESTGRKFSETKEKPKPAEVLIPKSDSDLDSMTDEQLEAYINEGK